MTEQRAMVPRQDGSASATQITLGQPSLQLLRSSAAWGESGAEARRYLTTAQRELIPAAIEEARSAMAPAARDLLIKGLASALTLVAGTGMGEAERKTWFASAAITLRDLPEDLFRRGIDEARRKADHPAKIVPLVISATEDAMRRRRSDLGKVEALRDCDRRMPWEPSAESEDRPATPEEIEAIKNELGLKTEPFGTRPKLAAGKPRMPTRDDYAALGVDPSVLDMLRTDSG